MTRTKYLLSAALGFFLMMSCTNITSHVSSNGTSSSSTTSSSSSSTVFTHTLKNFSYVADTTTTTSTNLILTITTDTSVANYQALTGFCTNSTCECELAWTQSSSANGTSYTYPRTIRNPLINVQSGSVQCNLLQSVWSEIADATVLSIRIIPISTNTSGINTSTLSYKKGTSVSASGDFLDDTLTPFRDIHRYTCFSKNPNRAYELVNQYSPASTTASTGTSTSIILGSRYCGVGTTSSSTGSGTSSCITPRTGYSAQSYYRNFFIRSDFTGTINSTNDTYDCPKVVESVRYSAGQTIPTSETNYYPLDTSFALATTYSTDWSVGVSAASSLYKNGDANSPATPVGCTNENVANRLTDGKVNISCIGYARKPNTDGTCGSIKDSNSRVRPLTRLRRYRVVYPPVFDSTGKVVAGHAFADEVYVADRLAVDATGATTGNMIYGPKPCNFAWFDHEGATTRDGSIDFYSNLRGDGLGLYAKPGYVATSDYQYIEHHSDPTNASYGCT